MASKKNKSSEQENKKDTALKVSRRGFLKGMGASAITTTLTSLPGLPASEAEAAVPAGMKEAVIRLTVNDQPYRLKVKSNWTLLDVLRRELGLTGSKKSCDRGSCGACTVLLEGKPVYACSLLAIAMDGKKIHTVESLKTGEKLHPLQKAFSEQGGYQCGFCTPGVMMSAKALLDENPNPDTEAIRQALAGNLCRCGAYPKILESVLSAASKA